MDNLSEKELEKALYKIKKGKRKSRFSKRIVVLVVLMNVFFTAAVLYIFLKVGNEPTTLIMSWFGFTTGELWMLSSIKKTKVKENENE